MPLRACQFRKESHGPLGGPFWGLGTPNWSLLLTLSFFPRNLLVGRMICIDASNMPWLLLDSTTSKISLLHLVQGHSYQYLTNLAFLEENMKFGTVI